jgi:hypothetical protein
LKAQIREKEVSENLGGPSFPTALLENPYPSLGIPTKFLSNFWFLFSSWYTAMAYLPTSK